MHMNRPRAEMPTPPKHGTPSSCRLTLRLTAARRPGCETKLLYPDHRPSLDLPEADGAAVAVEPVVRPYVEQADSSGEASRTRYRPRSLPICTRQLCRQ